MGAVSEHGHTHGVDGGVGGHGIALDAWNLHQSAHRIASQTQVVFDADLSSIFHLFRRAAYDCGKSAAAIEQAEPTSPGNRLPHRKLRRCV